MGILMKTPLIYSVSYFNFGSLVFCLGWLSPPSTPWRRDWTSLQYCLDLYRLAQGSQSQNAPRAK